MEKISCYNCKWLRLCKIHAAIFNAMEPDCNDINYDNKAKIFYEEVAIFCSHYFSNNSEGNDES